MRSISQKSSLKFFSSHKQKQRRNIEGKGTYINIKTSNTQNFQQKGSNLPTVYQAASHSEKKTVKKRSAVP